MIAIASLLTILTVSVLITRIATVALSHTGLSRESARFQARSAFTGVGFTTNESEKVVSHPVRRRILLLLMVLGNAGVVTAVSSLIVTLVDFKESGSIFFRVVVLITGLVLLWSIAYSDWVDRRLSHIISRALKRFTDLDVKDYAGLLHLAGDYRVAEVQVRSEDWLANRKLEEIRLRDEGIALLGVTRQDGTYIGIPGGSTKILPHDTLILYGRQDALENLDRRRKDREGDREHHQAVVEKEKEKEREKRIDPADQDNSS